MHHKSDNPKYITTFINFVETQFSLKVKILCSDNGPEFTMKFFYLDKGIIHQTSCVSTPQQNGVAKRKHRHLLNVARALLFQANLPKKFWGNTILTATYLINQTPTPLFKGKTPFEMFFTNSPHMTICEFLDVCVSPQHTIIAPTKFDARATRCLFLGYPYGQKGYRVCDLSTGKIFVSCNVFFHENVFPFPSSATDSPLVLPHTQSPTYDDDTSNPSSSSHSNTESFSSKPISQEASPSNSNTEAFDFLSLSITSSTTLSTAQDSLTLSPEPQIPPLWLT